MVMGEFVLISWPSHAQHLCDGIWKSLQKHYKTNFVMSVCTSDGAQRLVKAHQLILSIFCPAVKNTNEAILELDHQSDVDEESLNFLLEFIYKGKTKIAVNKMSNLKQAAKILGFKTLVESIISCENRKHHEIKVKESVPNINLNKAGNCLVNSEMSNTKSEVDNIKPEKSKPRSRNLGQSTKELGAATSYLKHKLKVKKKLVRMRIKNQAAVRSAISQSSKRPTNEPSENSFFNHNTQMCNLCNKQFISKSYFSKHVRRHLRPEITRQCPHCISKFPTNLLLENHVAEVHLKDMEGNIFETKYKCDECNYSAIYQHLIAFHKKKKHKVKAHKCDLCPYSCHSKADLQGHKEGKHGSTRPFICEICGYRAKTKKSMVCHASVHQEKVMCDECGASYSIRALKQHKRRVHNGGIKNIKCHLCSYTTTCTGYLRTHLKNVHKTN